MKKLQLEHVVRAASKICEDDEFIIIGSQSLHGKFPDIADEILVSQEVDLLAKKQIHKTEFLNVIGIDSPFHETFGYYADPVDANTAVLPKNWKNRLVHLKMENNESDVKAYCLEPHDLVIAKLAAGREKDKIFILALLDRGLVNLATIQLRLKETRVSAAKLATMEQFLTVIINKTIHTTGKS
jgi:Nucleotidyltransferase of unknown function (DUF6036)